MSLNTRIIKAVCFDLGNTLISFGPDQLELQFNSLAGTLTGLYGKCDRDRLKTVRTEQIIAPYSNGFIENTFEEISRELIEKMYKITPSDDQIDAVMQCRYDSFIQSVILPEGVKDLLVKISAGYRLALLSNYPCGRSIRDSLKNIGIYDLFETILVSADLGLVKPHERVFSALLENLSLPAPACVYIGDNWLADIQGSKRAGMQAILTTQYVPYETFEEQEGDFQPDARISSLSELETLLV